MAIDYSAEIEALKIAIASGATRVSYDGRSVDYDSYENLLARLQWLLGQQNGGVAAAPSSSFATFSRGDN